MMHLGKEKCRTLERNSRCIAKLKKKKAKNRREERYVIGYLLF